VGQRIAAFRARQQLIALSLQPRRRREAAVTSPPDINSVIEYNGVMGEKISASMLGRLLAARRRRVPGICPVCGTTFAGTGKRRYCSDRCRFRATYLRRKAQRTTSEEHLP
jgi:hypothetical protein